MGNRSEESIKLYETLIKRGYDRGFCELISKQLSTPWTAMRMLGYLRNLPKLREEDIVDEMLGILADRDRIRQKKEMEQAQSVINEIYMYGIGSDEE